MLAESESVNSAVVVCTAPVVQKLTQDRIPPNYIGVKRIRPKPSTHAPLLEKTSVVFKVTDEHGNERRMTRQEKKAVRLKMAQEKKLAIKTLKDQQLENRKRKLSQVDSVSALDDVVCADEDGGQSEKASTTTDESHSKYHQLSVNAETLEEELAEFSGDRREGLPPVVLSPPMALCASSLLLKSSVTPQRRGWIHYDSELSERWAKLLKDSMVPAITVRQGEDLRPLAYQLTPEAWSRMRPETTAHKKFETGIHQHVFDTKIAHVSDSNRSTLMEEIMNKASQPWVAMTCRPPSPLDVVTAVVFEYLFRETPFHVSCGAKFGSDFLVYDGPRSQRHAFAGLRVMLPTKDLPLPSAYQMAGYVRCLNTAGKLALLATVIEEQSDDAETLYRVAFVDVALEKILSAPSHQKYGRTEKRRDISRTLAKNTGR